MRELTSHKVSGLNEALKIEVIDEPGHETPATCTGITSTETA